MYYTRLTIGRESKLIKDLISECLISYGLDVASFSRIFLRLRLDLGKIGGKKKKNGKITFFGFRKTNKEKNMKESYVEKLLETSDKIFLIKL